MATSAQKLSDEEKSNTAASGSSMPDAGCSKSMAQHFAGVGGTSAMADAMAKCCGMFANGGLQPPASTETSPTETDEAPTGAEAAASSGNEA